MRVVLVWLLVACGAEVAPVEVPAAPVEAPVAEPEPEVAPEPAVEAGVAKLNADAATEEELMAGVPGMTQKMAKEIEEYRPFKSVKRFKKELGKYADEATVAGYLEHVYVPIDVNGSDKVTLMQLPGLDEAGADAVIAGRPYADGAAIKAALADKVTDLEVAKSLLIAR